MAPLEDYLTLADLQTCRSALMNLCLTPVCLALFERVLGLIRCLIMLCDRGTLEPRTTFYLCHFHLCCFACLRPVRLQMAGVPIESNEASVVVPKTDPAATCQALGLINSQNYVHGTND